MYEDLRSVFRSTAEPEEEEAEFGQRTLRKSSSMPSLKDSLRKLFRMG